MNEQEWLACTEPTPMLKFLRGNISNRRMRLFACACCRRAWSNSKPGRLMIVEVAEQYADGAVGDDALTDVLQNEIVGPFNTADIGELWLVHKRMSFLKRVPFEVVMQVASRAEKKAPSPKWKTARDAELVIQASLLRCIFGSPFRTVTIPPTRLQWNDGTVVKIAQAIYDHRRFEDMPILADALEEAGCDNEDILSHCRGPGPHARGCWALDLILEKS